MELDLADTVSWNGTTTSGQNDWKSVVQQSSDFLGCLISTNSSRTIPFSISNILNYFIFRKACDGNATNDFKDINSKAFPLFKAE